MEWVDMLSAPVRRVVFLHFEGPRNFDPLSFSGTRKGRDKEKKVKQGILKSSPWGLPHWGQKDYLTFNPAELFWVRTCL